MAEAQKGVFDHLAEYLLQPAPAGPPSPPGAPDAQPRAEGAEAPAAAEPARPVPAALVKGGETLVFVETAEKLVVEKEVFVREEVVLRKLVENRVQEIDDTVRRTEVEVQRLSPEEAERIVPADKAVEPPLPSKQAVEPPAPFAPLEERNAAPQVPPASMAQPAKPAPAAVKPAPRADERSASWWLWFALILCAGVLIAFAVGQFLGSASG